MKISDLTFCVASDAYEAGRTEDGRPYTAEMYYVMAEDGDGNRWRHDVDFRGCIAYNDFEGFPLFRDIRTKAKDRATTLLNKIVADGSDLNMWHWRMMRPAYGSVAYQQYGAHEDWMDEQLEG